MSLVLLWQFIWIGEEDKKSCTDILEKKGKKSRSKKTEQNKQQKESESFSYVPSECNVQFQLYQGVQMLVRKKYEKNSNGFNVCFQK